ncbi:hypothetical protein SAMD00079811_40950 [Scytonema sp. HK-05]|uniref:hypothetical protein n=1 Tax=Scytonema sp. HK-05 TaxID=1137095 RepID=UPI0009378C11|nr:hypothetical protein [Scytonema sp. HK-05]OKH61082.1 hypothetical protein NIES2130_00995 [Scytonema sp. HK-05]BAY46483.1 hypothetical protein SAMD00079811_40950 [Scytonema sp. HK-05]
MGRWTPLILMAGGLAILLGTLLGISFPMDGRNNTAQAPAPESAPRGKESKVLPANINVNSTAAGNTPANDQRNNVAQTNQNSNTNNDQVQDDTSGGNNNQPGNQSPGNQSPGNQSPNETNQNTEPVRALW